MLPTPPSSAPGEAPLPSPDGAGAPAATDPPHGTGSTTTTRRVTWTLAGLTAAGCAYVALADPNKASSLYPLCPFKALTGYDCPGCGITRAIHAGLTGHPLRALDHNALFVAMVVVGAVWFGVSWLRQRRGRPSLKLEHPAVWGAGFGVLVVAFWVVRNLPWGPFHWLGSGASGV